MHYMYPLVTEADRDEYYRYKKELMEVPEFEFAMEEFDDEDASLIQMFNVNGKMQFKLKCDELVGAVYIESKILLDEFYKFHEHVERMDFDLKW